MVLYKGSTVKMYHASWALTRMTTEENLQASPGTIAPSLKYGAKLLYH